jgi:hypothetical protein
VIGERVVAEQASKCNEKEIEQPVSQPGTEEKAATDKVIFRRAGNVADVSSLASWIMKGEFAYVAFGFFVVSLRKILHLADRAAMRFKIPRWCARFTVLLLVANICLGAYAAWNFVGDRITQWPACEAEVDPTDPKGRVTIDSSTSKGPIAQVKGTIKRPPAQGHYFVVVQSRAPETKNVGYKLVKELDQRCGPFVASYDGSKSRPCSVRGLAVYVLPYGPQFLTSDPLAPSSPELPDGAILVSTISRHQHFAPGCPEPAGRWPKNLPI